MLPSLEIVYILAKSADSGDMPHNVAFHLGLHCLPKEVCSTQRVNMDSEDYDQT